MKNKSKICPRQIFYIKTSKIFKNDAFSAVLKLFYNLAVNFRDDAAKVEDFCDKLKSQNLPLANFQIMFAAFCRIISVLTLDDFESSYIETQTICLAFCATALSDDSLNGVGRFTVALLGMI